MKAFVMTAKTLWNSTCSVTITTEKGTGRDTLQPAAEMFEMETDDSTDIDTVLRATTGVLRFIVTDASQLNDILPETVFGTRVEVSVTYASGGSKWKFVGYVERTEYSQDWDGEPFEMELPVRDAVSLFDSVRMDANDSSYFGKTCTVARYIYEALTAAGFYKSDNTGFTPGNIYVEADDGDFFEQRVQREWFLEKNTSYADGESSVSMEGMAFDEVLERLLRANGMEMWIEGDDVHFRRGDMPKGLYYMYSWSLFEAIANETSYNKSSVSLPTFGSLESNITNMATGNSMGYLPGARRVIVNQSLDDTDLFELDSDWLEAWNMVCVSYDTQYDAVLWLWRSKTSQRNVTVRRQYYDVNTEVLRDLSDSTLIGAMYNENPIIGGVICDIESCAVDELASKSSLPVASSPSIVFLYTYINFYGRGDSKTDEELLDNTTAFINASSPVSIDGDTGGCICLTARLKTIRTRDQTISSVRYLPTSAPATQWGCFIEGRIQLENQNGVVYSWSDAEGKWVQSDQTISTIYFDESGEVVGNYVDNKATYHYRSDNNNDGDHSVTYGETGDLIGLKQSVRFKYQDGEGYMMPLDSLPSGRYVLRVMLFAPWGYGTFRTSGNDHYHRGHWNWLQNYHILEVLEGLSVTWHPVCVTGTLPDISAGQTGTYTGVYKDLKTDRSHVCGTTADDGEDVNIDVDSWGDGDYQKWGNTLQPDICRLSVFDKISVQLTAMRRTIEYEDAVDDSVVPTEYTQDYGGESVTLRKVGNSWKSSNEGGKKKFLQVV